MQLDKLWDFMQVDLKADRFEAEMRNSPNRQKLLKDRNFLVEQQANAKKIEEILSQIEDRIAALKDEADRLMKKSDNLVELYRDEEPENKSEVEEAMQKAQKLLDDINRCEQELVKLRNDVDVKERQLKEIHVRAAKTKAEYDKIKVEYNNEFERDSKQLNQLRAEAEEESKKLDIEMLERYRFIKKRTPVPMAMLNGNQCGGCFMQLPAVVLQEIEGSEKLVQCDNCGRILYSAKK